MRRVRRFSLPALIAAPLALTGCAPRVAFPAFHAPGLDFYFDVSGRYTVQRAPLDDNREVALVIDLPKQGAATDPELLLVIRSCPSSIEEYRLKPPSTSCESPPVEVHFEKLEIRSDASRNHVWITDPESSVILATLDHHTGVALLLPDPPPVWATLTGGEVLPGELAPGMFQKQNSD